mmetsp:Transcript_66231/g.158030  ORF Transcript_66231/g.158030 Transcript_66231/m.158030 type:complete len:90 (+) Transcript_66231:67-336(+)
MRTISTLIVLLTLTLCAARSPGLNRRLQEDGNVTFVPLPPKIQYPLDPGAMIGGAFVGALGVPFLFGIWAFLEKRKPGGGALAALFERE